MLSLLAHAASLWSALSSVPNVQEQYDAIQPTLDRARYHVAKPADGGVAWRNAYLRAEELVGLMTIEEKVGSPVFHLNIMV